jgi:hypothetical protein
VDVDPRDVREPPSGCGCPASQDGAWWKLLSSGFTHLAIVHLRVQHGGTGHARPADGSDLLGTWRFLALYGSSILGGSLFALLLSPINTFTVGASGGLFGLMGGLLIIALLRHGDARTILIWLVGQCRVHVRWRGIHLLAGAPGRSDLRRYHHLRPHAVRRVPRPDRTPAPAPATMTVVAAGCARDPRP